MPSDDEVIEARREQARKDPEYQAKVARIKEGLERGELPGEPMDREALRRFRETMLADDQ